MKITLKNIKHSEFASQETNCYEATVYVDGKRSFIASNQGFGGCDDYHPLTGSHDYKGMHKQIEAINKELNKEIIIIYEGTKREFTVKKDLETVCGNLINEWLHDKHVKKILKKIAIIDSENVVSTVNLKPTKENIESVKKAKWWEASFKILNTMDFNEAAKLIA